MDAQIDNFANTRQDIISNIGLPAAMQLFKKSLFSVTIGSNDFINNYLTPVLSTAKQKLVSPEMFVEAMISRFRLQLTVKTLFFFSHFYTYESHFDHYLSVEFATYSILQRLYNLGARKIVVANVGPIGCIPYERDANPTSGDSCAVFPNQLAQLFNSQLRSLITELSNSLEGSKFVYADVYHIVEDILENYTKYGLCVCVFSLIFLFVVA